jgi:mRNA interferase MazF
MGTFMKGDIVALEYPYSDFSGFKKRPAVVTAGMFGDYLVLCPISSRLRKDEYCVELDDDCLDGGSLKLSSFVRTNLISTVDKSVILYKIGRLGDTKVKEVEEKLVEMFTK